MQMYYDIDWVKCLTVTSLIPKWTDVDAMACEMNTSQLNINREQSIWTYTGPSSTIDGSS